MPTANIDRFKKTLSELFMFDRADLDFGIYRIMNAKRAEITRFLDQDLLPQVRAELDKLGSDDRATLEADLQKLVQQYRDDGFDPESSLKVQDLRKALAKTADPDDVQDRIFSRLADFFARYYKDGDYLSLRRYREGVYALPYEGEEVKLYWANADQYYIKSGESFRDYAFRLDDGRRVHFKLVSADTEQNNNKPDNGNERRFILTEEEPVSEDNGEFVVRFEYRTDPEKRKQTALNAAAALRILADAASNAWRAALAKKEPTAKNADRTLLDRYLADYTARNSFDYFIHKDLAGFLRRELDFYIKSEVMRLDDIDHADAPTVEHYLSEVRVMRAIGHKVIAMLAQLEDFQKKLWLKKKFVVETNYCVTLDRVPEELYGQIVANDAQRDEWVRLFAIDEIPMSLVAPGFSTPLALDFLKANPFLVLDTKFFSQAFTSQLLAHFDNLDDQIDGVLIHSENFQAINLLMTRYQHDLNVVFIDPPYNTGEDGFPYKDSYQHSSWMSMMEDRLRISKTLLAPNSLVFITIDFVEVSRLRLLCDEVFGVQNFLADVAWEKRYTRSNNAKLFYSLKDTMLTYRGSDGVTKIREARSDKSRGNYTNPDNDVRGPWISSSYVNPARKEQRLNLVYPIKNPNTGQEIEHPTHAWKYDIDTHRAHIAGDRLYWGLKGDYEWPRLKSFLSEADEGMVPIDVWHYKETGTTDDGGNEIKSLFGYSAFDNPKPTSLVRRALQLDPLNGDGTLVIDFFVGSGTTGHAVIDLNREDEGTRKYILVEMGSHFDAVVKPRIEKVVYSRDWRDGKPVSRDGSSHMFKYVRLESYEDALNNLELQRTPVQQALLDRPDARPMREDYLLHYMLDVESRGSLLPINQFAEPFDYQLKIATGSVGESSPVTVDLVETFNYLLGLRVRGVTGRRDVRVVDGVDPDGTKVLVIWRSASAMPNQTLDEFFEQPALRTRVSTSDIIYVNGDNNLESLRRNDETWQVRLIEEEFKQRMFDVRDI